MNSDILLQIQKQQRKELHESLRIDKLLLYKIKLRINSFDYLWNYGTEEDFFAELLFCLLTPQCQPRPCWNTVLTLYKKNLWFKGSASDISNYLNHARFKYKKAVYILKARELFVDNDIIVLKNRIKDIDDPYEARNWLVKTVDGFGYKEASHFLRNIGMTNNFAILDRHILRTLKNLGLLSKIPASLSQKKYLMAEDSFIEYSHKVGIPLSHLDFIFFYKNTGDIFK